MCRHEIDAASAQVRLDHLVARLVPGTSINQARRWIEQGEVLVDGRPARKGTRGSVGQVIEIRVVPEGAAGPHTVVPEPEAPLEVLYSDEHLVAIGKRPGIPSHPLRARERGTAANALVARFPECAVASFDPREGGLGHRLDRGTSGVLVAARSRQAWTRLRDLMRSGACEKTYLAQVAGVPRTAAGVITAAIGRAGRRTGRVVIEGGRGVLEAETAWTVVEARGASGLVRARLHAGRAHQIRAHLASAGHPIIGDELYGDEASRALSNQLGATGLRLHAESVHMPHPITGEPLCITAPLPEWAIPSERGGESK